MDMAGTDRGTVSTTGGQSRGHLVAWTAFLLGIVASVSTNIAHAHPGLGPKLSAAWAPLALSLVVELSVRPPRVDRLVWMVIRWMGTGGVAVISAVVSYRHQHALLLTYGEDTVSAAILPLSVDGLMVTAAAVLLSLYAPRPREIAPARTVTTAPTVALASVANLVTRTPARNGRQSSLTAEDKREIQREYQRSKPLGEWSPTRMAKQYGVQPKTIQRAVNGTRLPEPQISS